LENSGSSSVIPHRYESLAQPQPISHPTIYLDSRACPRHLEQMTAGLTLGKLIGPIAAATILNVIMFALAWRGHRQEREQGKPPRLYEAGLVGYMIAAGLILYVLLEGLLTTGLELFGAALMSEGLGVVITYTFVHAFVLSRGRPWCKRAFPIAASVLLTAGAFAAVLTA
jgi:hypothetical protein